MEEDDFFPNALDGVKSDPHRTEPAPRAGHIGDLARRLCGTTDLAPDFTAAVPLSDALRHQYTDLVASNFEDRILQLRRFIAADNEPESDRHNRAVIRRFHEQLRAICRPFLYDFASVVGVLARAVELAQQPVAPLPTATAEVVATFIRVPPGYGVGDRLVMPNGRRGIVVVARDPATGMAGVIPVENHEPEGAHPAMTEDGAAEF